MFADFCLHKLNNPELAIENFLKVRNVSKIVQILEQKLVAKETEEQTLEMLQEMARKQGVPRIEKLLIGRSLAEGGFIDRAVEVFLSINSLEELRRLRMVLSFKYFIPRNTIWIIFRKEYRFSKPTTCKAKNHPCKPSKKQILY